MDNSRSHSHTDNEKPVLSVIIPLFNEETNIDVLMESLRDVLAGLGVSYEIILVDDGSMDGSWGKIENASQKDRRIKGLSFSRNFGQQNALLAGMESSSGKALVTMDGDLQHPPGVVAELYDAWEQGYKIVQTRRIDSEDSSLFKRLAALGFNRIFSKLSGLPLEKGVSDYRLIDRQVFLSMKQMRDSELFLRGITHWVGFPSTTVTYQAHKRHTGKSKWNLLKLVRYSTGALVSFSIIPLKLSIWIGIITSFLSFIEIVYILVRYSQGATVPGWASTLTVISFMFGILFILLGIIGTYLGRIYETLKNRPRYIVNDTAGFDNRNQNNHE